MLVSVIIPNYNGLSLLKKNLPAVLRVLNICEYTSKKKIELLVVDDASTDESVSYLEKSAATYTGGVPIRIIRNEHNLGFAPSVNKAVKQAKGEYLYLLNSDVTPEQGFLEPLLKNMKDERMFAVGSMDKSIERGKEVLRGRGLGKWERGFLAHRRGEVDGKDTLWVNGGSGLFRKKIWEKLGGFTELYAPYYWEDIDLSYRALKSGYEVLFEPESIVTHRHEEGAILKTQHKGKVKSIAYRNMWLFVWLNATDRSILREHLRFLPIHLLRAFIKGDFRMVHGFFLAFLQLPKILQLRTKSMKHFRKTDSEVVGRF